MNKHAHTVAFDALPTRPAPLSSNYGMIVHLISRQEGIIKSLRHLDEINSLPSVHVVEIPSAEGDVLVKTVDIRTDAGYVLLMHENPTVLQADYERILQLQDTLFEVAGHVVKAVEKVPLLEVLEEMEMHATHPFEASANKCTADDRARAACAKDNVPVSARSPPHDRQRVPKCCTFRSRPVR